MSPADMTSVHETFDDRLIECVRQNTVIWDPARKSCQDRVLRDNVWKEIAEKLNRSVKDCRIRWRTIRDSYKKVKKSLESGSLSGWETRSKYRTMDCLKFLDTAIDARRSQKSKSRGLPTVTVKVEEEVVDVTDGGELPLDEDDGEDEGLFENTLDVPLQHDYEAVDADPSNEDTTIAEEPLDQRKRMRLQNGNEDPIQNIVISREETITQETENHLYTFFRSMAQSVSSFPEHLIIETKLKVCQLISEMEMKALMERSSYPRPS